MKPETAAKRADEKYGKNRCIVAFEAQKNHPEWSEKDLATVFGLTVPGVRAAITAGEYFLKSTLDGALEDDLRKLFSLPPYHLNPCSDDGIFAKSLEARYGASIEELEIRIGFHFKRQSWEMKKRAILRLAEKQLTK